MPRETAILVGMTRKTRERLEKQAANAGRNRTAQIIWLINNTELDGITPIRSVRHDTDKKKT